MGSGLRLVGLILAFSAGCGDSSAPSPDGGAADAANSPDGAVDAGPPPAAGDFPFTDEEMRDESTLGLEVIEDTRVPSTCVPGATNREVRVRYWSHSWHDGDWRGTVAMTIPETIQHAGVVAMADIEADWQDCVANQLGIVTAGQPNSDEHFGLMEIHDVYEHILCEMVGRDDPSWSPYWPFVALRMRALTAVGAAVGTPPSSVHVFGSSITGSMSYSLALYDDRVSSTGGTGAYGGIEDFLAEPADPDLYFAWCRTGCNPYAMSPELMASLRASADLTVLAASLDVPVLVIAPTNDQNASPALMQGRMASVPRLQYASIANVGHSTADPRTPETFRMWVEHVELGRMVNTVDTTTLEVRGAEVVASATVTERAPIDEVRFWYLPLEDDTFLGAEFWWTTPDPYFPSAVWQSVPMTRAGDRWEARLPSPGSRWVAGWVDAADSIDGRPGYAAGFIELLPLVAPDAEADLCAALSTDCHARTAGACNRFLKRCTDGCTQSYARCLAGHALDFCDAATEAACEDARTGCVGDACRADWDRCAASGLVDCTDFHASCLSPCEQALFAVALSGSDTDIDYLVDNCGLGTGG